jgi:hypothetical protein
MDDLNAELSLPDVEECLSEGTDAGGNHFEVRKDCVRLPVSRT